VILGTALQYGVGRDRAVWRLRLPVVHNGAPCGYKFEFRPLVHSGERICFLWYRVYFPAAELIEPAAVS